MKRRVAFDLRWKTGTLDHGVGAFLEALVAEGKEEFDFVCYDDGNDAQFVQELASPVEYVKLPWDRYSAKGQLLLPRRLRNDQIHLFHSPFYVLPVFTGIPIVVNIYDVIPFHRRAGIRGLKRAMICAMNLLAAHKASAILTVSDFSKRDIIQTLRIPESKVTVAPPAAGRFVLVEPQPDLYAKHVPYFACITARHFESKNTVLALKAWNIFRQRTGLKHKLLVGGRTTEAGKAAFRQAGWRDGCELIGFVPDENLSSFFSCAEAFVIPSLYEGFGIPALEAMACGAPVISSNQCSLPEVCGDAALYFDPTNAEDLAEQMIRVSTDRELRSRMIASGKLQSKKFSYIESARRMLAVYDQVLRSAN